MILALARLFDAPTALQVGLVSEVPADVAALHARADALAATLAGHAPLTMQVTMRRCAGCKRGWRKTISTT